MKIIVLILGLFACTLQASQEQTFKEQVQWAKSEASTALNPSSIPLDVNDYCKDATCRQQVANPKEAGLSDTEINAKKGAAYANNDMAQSITHNFNQGRPDVENDPAVQFALIAQDNAFELTHGISNEYVDCDTGEVCLKNGIKKSCKVPTNHPVSCTKAPYFTELTTTQGQTIFNRNPGVNRYGPTITLPEKAKQVRAVLLPDGLTQSTKLGVITRLYINDQVVYETVGTQTNCGYCIGEIASQTVNLKTPIDVDGPLALAHYYSSIGNKVDGWWNLRGAPYGMIFWDTPSYEYEWRASCDALIPQCKPQPEQCIEGEETRIIEGVSVTLPCWKYETLYQCEMDNTCDAIQECEEVSRECSLQQNGVCVEEKVTKECQETSCKITQMECGEQSFCLDGDCYEATPTLNDEFDQSAAALAGLAAAAEGLGNPPKIFTGNAMKCDIKLAGFNDCCKDSGWGQGLGAGCSDGEKALGDAKEKGLTIYVGKYCAKKVLGACTRKKKSYCVFDSKLAKIIQQQGVLGQLGKSLGSAKSPTCNPITPEELSAIDFEHIDFQEFYPDMTEGMELPDFDEIKDRLESANGG
ncbi:type-F conjugative transfer system mating-pair stabilization protein TraN [Vibrio genomosp. F6]|uniref:Type-F conjugative transfer system mating-pair stabilization protein TraN n=1 Tax=Vibrio genomosp. F6 str. FF-238 TaxID=1191298 RepID=A0A1E5CSH6_9VIBR|nr:type-F conjugative transfer system mating-pair stabilization protein TraN [Vibrio genomosp. F6]OEE72846.1 type-F conjugative transfer system mating-pair stabilization protein TraN [Vibrio genomosp. F6 str. FF-238]